MSNTFARLDTGQTVLQDEFSHPLYDQIQKLDRLGVFAQFFGTENLTVQLNGGTVWFNSTPYDVASQNVTFTAPSTHPRIDVISIDSSGGVVHTVGSENVSPTQPAVPIGNIPLSSVYLRVGSTQIFNSDQGGTSSYVLKDLRNILQKEDVAPGSGDVTGPASAIGDNLASYNSTTGKIIKDSGASVASIKAYADAAASAAQTNAEAASIPDTYLDTDGTLAADSDVKVATQKATKTYVDAHAGGGSLPAYY